MSGEPGELHDVTVELDGDDRTARARILDAGDEDELARTLVHEKYTPRNHGDLTRWRDRALAVAIDLGTQSVV